MQIILAQQSHTCFNFPFWLLRWDLCFRFVNDFGRSTVDCWCGQLYSSHWGLWLGRRSMLTRRRCRISGYLICIHPNGVVHAIKNIFATTATPSSGFQVLLETVQTWQTHVVAPGPHFKKISIATWRVLLMFILSNPSDQGSQFIFSSKTDTKTYEYCWWKKSCTSLRLVLYPVIYKVL